jgi:hypothetical protein
MQDPTRRSPLLNAALALRARHLSEEQLKAVDERGWTASHVIYMFLHKHHNNKRYIDSTALALHGRVHSYFRAAKAYGAADGASRKLLQNTESHAMYRCWQHPLGLKEFIVIPLQVLDDACSKATLLAAEQRWITIFDSVRTGYNAHNAQHMQVPRYVAIAGLIEALGICAC